MKDASLGDIETAGICEVSNPALTSGDLDNQRSMYDFAFCGQEDVTWKSFACDGGEVEVCDVTRPQDETIPLPEEQLGITSHDRSSTDLSYCGQLCQDHSDHPYCSREDGVAFITAFSQATNASEETVNEMSDVLYKSLNCTGGEIQISDGIELADETVPLPAEQSAIGSELFNNHIDPSILVIDQNVQNDDHFDHPYFHVESYPTTPRGKPDTTQEPSIRYDAGEEVKQISSEVPSGLTVRQQDAAFSPFVNARREAEESDSSILSLKSSPLPDDQVECHLLPDDCVKTSITLDHIQDEDKQTISTKNNEVIGDTDPSANIASSQNNTLVLDDESLNFHLLETPNEDSTHQENTLPSVHQIASPDCNHLTASAKTSSPAHLENASQEHLSSEHNEYDEAKDSGLCSFKNEPVVSDTREKPHTENLPDVLRVLSECPTVESALKSGLLSPIVRRASLFILGASKEPAADQVLVDESAFECEKTLLAPINPTALCVEHLQSPMPRPLFNSTALGCKAQPYKVTEPVEAVEVTTKAVPEPDVEKPLLDNPLIPNGPLQLQLRQMAEFLFLASGKMGPTAVSAPIPPSAAAVGPSAKVSSVESHSVCVGNTPRKWVDHSINTSGQFEKKRDISVLDSCTLTDPLLWNIPPGSLERLPRQELEQRLRSSMIMVEALVQQLATARTQGCSVGPAPSDLREKLVQTDHTEFTQTTLHRNLYLEALSRIGELELDEGSLQNLIQCMQDMRSTMTSLSFDTDAALSNMEQIGVVVRKDHQSLVSHYGQMRSLFEKSKEMHTRMMQKVKDALEKSDDMRVQMEEAFTAKEAAFRATEQLRTHCSTEISELERIVGSQQELSAALDQTYPELVALNQASAEILNSASDLLSTTTNDQSSLMKELCTVRGLLQKATPMLLRLNEKAAAALRERDEHITARVQVMEEKEQVEQELNHTSLNLQATREQLCDFKLEVTILTTEMGVLRQKLAERDEEKAQLERQVTELSATTSSTLASYTFLEKALSSETTKLQESWKDIQEAKDRANELEVSLRQSEQRVCELNEALTLREEQFLQLQALSKSQTTENQQLQDVCTRLTGVQEMNEFLQMENELAREQMAESESMLKANLKGLRERNIQCEDLKGELSQLQFENRSLQDELESTRSRTSTIQLELEEKLAQAGTEITLLHHTLRGVTNGLQEALDQKSESVNDKDSQAVPSMDRRHPSSSFVDSVMVALTAEKEEESSSDASPEPIDKPDPQGETLFSERSAFTRIAAITPKKNLRAEEFESDEDDQSNVSKLFADLDGTVTELISTLKLVRQRKDAELEELHNIICGLQVEQQTANNSHQAEVLELKRQISRLNSLAERGSEALQQKAQDDKTLTKLMSDIQETQESLHKHKTDSNELRREVAELRRSLQQSKAESQILRVELKRADGQSASAENLMEEKIQLLKEVERLKLSLEEVEKARVKLLERAKRHQIIHQSNQQKSENELQLLNNMINKVRETLLSLPNVLKDSEALQQLVEYIG
ncbi:sperm-associated antigen 5 [Antennarius striatus]|uniref:sperm-associated antigen 5 n=1 Tax=Antennarius striatus TaxID=241820 RepID=UPI0035B0F8C0